MLLLDPLDQPVLEMDDRAGEGGHVGLVGDHQHGDPAGLDQFGEQPHDLDRALAVEIAGRLVGEQKIRAGDERALLRRKYLGFVFQGFNLLARTSALENVELPLLYRGDPKRERREAAMAALDKVGLKDWWDHTPAELSGGQQQRVAIARAIVTSPDVLLADEPTGNLDSERSIEIMELLTDLNQTSGITVLMVTHEPDMAAFARTIIHFKDGLVERIETGHAQGEVVA